MNWVCDSCGYENEYNDESQPTECLCCGETAPEHKIIQAKRDLEKFHKEKEHRARLEELRLQAMKQQEKIERIVGRFAKFVGITPVLCIVAVFFAISLIGFNTYQKNILPSRFVDNVKMSSFMKAPASSKTMLAHMSALGTNYGGNLLNNIVELTPSNKKNISGNVLLLVQDDERQIKNIQKNFKQNGSDLVTGVGNIGKNMSAFLNNVLQDCNNLGGNEKLFWKQASKNVKGIITFVLKKMRRA